MRREIVLGVFADPDLFLHAAEKARQQGWQELDAITPYPLHGIEHALGIPASRIPYVTLITGFLGGIGGFTLAAWTSAAAWPINIGGKAFLSWQAFVPVMFESGILIGGICTFVTLWKVCHLPKAKPRLWDARLTDDHFGLVIPLKDGVQEKEVSEFLKGAGADEVRRLDA